MIILCVSQELSVLLVYSLCVIINVVIVHTIKMNILIVYILCTLLRNLLSIRATSVRHTHTHFIFREPGVRHTHFIFREPGVRHAHFIFREPGVRHTHFIFREPGVRHTHFIFREPGVRHTHFIFREPGVRHTHFIFREPGMRLHIVQVCLNEVSLLPNWTHHWAWLVFGMISTTENYIQEI